MESRSTSVDSASWASIDGNESSAYGGSRNTSPYLPSRRDKTLETLLQYIRTRDANPMVATFSFIVAQQRRSWSTKSTQPVPLLSASSPTAPLPANRSSALDQSGPMDSSMEKTAERTKSVAGLVTVP